MEQTIYTKRIIAFTFMLWLGLSQLTAQQIVAGSRIIQLVPKAEPTWFEAEQATVNKLSENLNIWEVQFANEEAAIAWEWPEEVLTVQKNHKLVKRAIPNDVQYADQWQHNTTPANAPLTGTLNGDVGSEEAWNTTTGGQLPISGDDIVVCILDDGINLNHEDLISNLWVNADEQPENGIDDDNNGFVDDYQGWNIYTTSDAIDDPVTAIRSHGTRVAGMVGAVGNNNIGISGVNWDVRLMIVVADGDESDAIAGYDYPLTLRKRYNETNGAEGAFVVATNASWGVDFGKPSDAPIWCALYDSLGKAGILNVAATANSNINVDVSGDLPTACPSDFLISVTNSNVLGDKVSGAAYGAQSIDLSAPGEQVLTTTVNGYGTDFGTSFAAPMVAGAIALCYSTICEDLEDVRTTDPQNLAGLMRDAVLEQVKAQPSLNGITTTGGSLWLPGALDGTDDACARYTSVDEVTAESYSLTIYPNPANQQVTITGEETISFQVFNAIGELQYQSGTNAYTHQVDISSWPKGIYLIQWTGNGINGTEKLIKF